MFLRMYLQYRFWSLEGSSVPLSKTIMFIWTACILNVYLLNSKKQNDCYLSFITLSKIKEEHSHLTF